MKALILVVSAEPALGRKWNAVLNPFYSVTNAAPEDAVFRMLEARFAAMVICHSVPKRKLVPLMTYIERTAASMPVVLLRTGRERQKIEATEVVVAGSDSAVLNAVRRATAGNAFGSSAGC